MKNLNFVIISWIIVFSTAMVSCKDEVKLNGARVSPKEITTFEGADPLKLYLYLYPTHPDNPEVRWETSSDAILTVSQDGMVSPLIPGIAYAFVYQGDRALDSCRITVNQVVRVQSIALERNVIKVAINAPRMLNSTIMPEDATYTGITWTSSDETVATVSSGGMVSGVGFGTATITATTVDGGHNDQCVVTIVGPVENLLKNPGFEEPIELEAPFTTQLHEIGGDWQQITIEWVREFYKQGEEKSGPIGLGPGTQNAVTNTQRANILDLTNGNLITGNSPYFNVLGGLRGNCAARIANAGGNLLGGFYQIITVTPGYTYRFGAIVGMRGNAAAQVIKDYETLKFLSPDGMEVYHEVLMSPFAPEEGDVYELYNGQMAFIRNIKGTYTIPEGVTQIRFQFDMRPFGGQNNIPVTLIDDCYFEFDIDAE